MLIQFISVVSQIRLDQCQAKFSVLSGCNIDFNCGKGITRINKITWNYFQIKLKATFTSSFSSELIGIGLVYRGAKTSRKGLYPFKFIVTILYLFVEINNLGTRSWTKVPPLAKIRLMSERELNACVNSHFYTFIFDLRTDCSIGKVVAIGKEVITTWLVYCFLGLIAKQIVIGSF